LNWRAGHDTIVYRKISSILITVEKDIPKNTGSTVSHARRVPSALARSGSRRPSFPGQYDQAPDGQDSQCSRLGDGGVVQFGHVIVCEPATVDSHLIDVALEEISPRSRLSDEPRVGGCAEIASFGDEGLYSPST
jgi:hypothetical protein